jgi:2-oxoglutarate ferredoxin oxidoreductase subunit beta
MPAIGTGAVMANQDLKAIGVSGDGDSASIGMGQFIHVMRRNVPMVYIIENNGVYGLTKGQFSATADKGQTLKYAGTNSYLPVDLCLQAMASNAGFVARSFAGDPKQVKELIKAAFSYEGTAILDIISPCVTFNNRDESTKSYAWGKEHEIPIHDVTYVPKREEISVDYDPGEVITVELHDGSKIVLKKLDGDHEPTNRAAALGLLEESAEEGYLATGLIYLNTEMENLVQAQNLISEPLATLGENRLRPDQGTLTELLVEFM